MSEWIIRCSRPGCDTWQRIEFGSNRTDDWITVWLNNDNNGEVVHLCTPWCLNIWSMKFDFETEIYRWETDGGFIPPDL